MAARGFVGLVATRLIRRRGPAPRWAAAVGRVGVAGLVLAGLGLALGARGPGVVAVAWLATLASLIAALVARLRPVLVVSVLSLALGVASMFVVLGVGSGVEQLLVRSLARLNGHAMVNEYGLDFGEYEQVARALEADPRVHAASPFVFGVGAIVVVGDEPSQAGPERVAAALEEAGEPVVVTLKGVDPARLARFSGIEELFTVGSLAALRPAEPRRRPSVALGARLARRIGAEPGAIVRIVVPAEIRQDPAAQDNRPRHGELEVVAILDTGFAEFDASFALVHLSAAQALVFGQRRASGVEIELRDARVASIVPSAEALAERLNAPELAQGKPPRFRAGSWVQGSATLTSIRQTKAILAVFLSLIVLVASGSLLGALLLLVRRERPHIGVLASLGARPRQLFWVFERVGVTIGVLGSGLGLALGAISLAALSLLRLDLDPEVYMIDHLPVAFVLTDMLIPTALALLVCVVVTGPIAHQVGKIRPLALLR